MRFSTRPATSPSRRGEISPEEAGLAERRREIGMGSQMRPSQATSSALRTVAVEVAQVWAAAVATGVARWEPMGGREYYEYQRAIYGDITHKAILVDAASTHLAPTEQMAQVYRTIGEKYGVEYSEDEILMRYRRAYAQPWGRSHLRLQQKRPNPTNILEGLRIVRRET